MTSATPAVSIDVASCAAFETIVANTGSSVYEVVVLGSEPGKVLVRGGKHFTTFCRAVIFGSMQDSGAIERYTIGVGLRMKFYLENMVIVTSAVQSLSRREKPSGEGTLPDQWDVPDPGLVATVQRAEQKATS